MAENQDRAYNRKVDELITIIRFKKLRLEAKYGPEVKKLWEVKND